MPNRELLLKLIRRLTTGVVQNPQVWPGLVAGSLSNCMPFVILQSTSLPVETASRLGQGLGFMDCTAQPSLEDSDSKLRGHRQPSPAAELYVATWMVRALGILAIPFGTKTVSTHVRTDNDARQTSLMSEVRGICEAQDYIHASLRASHYVCAKRVGQSTLAALEQRVSTVPALASRRVFARMHLAVSFSYRVTCQPPAPTD